MSIQNKQKFFKKMDERLRGSEKQIRKAMTRSTILVQKTAVESILSGGKSGDIVQKYNPRRTHQQSAPFEPPASDTGFLAASISQQVTKESVDRGIPVIVGSVMASAEYAIHLEFGTSNMEPRPFLQPALEANKQKIRQFFVSEGLLR